MPDSDNILTVSALLASDTVDAIYFDKPYFLAPADGTSNEAYAPIREGMQRDKVAAIAHTVLFRRLRNVLIQPDSDRLIATTLHFEYEVRPAREAFKDVSEVSVNGEMLELAQHIINTKAGNFDPA